MACYFGWVVIDLYELFNMILINNYVKSRRMAIAVRSFCLSHNIFKFLLINYMCETVSTKASATADLLNKLSYVTCDGEIREIVSIKMSSLKYYKNT
ncbi:hypothetical protein ALC62_13931 [Cyphomyrmex costatus]|uniref:Uncharacterized protein n=1 Tax=Cyphomyrmex costatus TaxID=456900 RepID=A0A195C5P2_9HYME|nr:hypothetical protein ALC62_13931 [Cyphomyrmex costatus]